MLALVSRIATYVGRNFTEKIEWRAAGPEML